GKAAEKTKTAVSGQSIADSQVNVGAAEYEPEARSSGARLRLPAAGGRPARINRLGDACYDTCFKRRTLRSRSIPTRYLLRNLWPTIPPSWNPSSALGASRLSTTTGKFLY